MIFTNMAYPGKDYRVQVFDAWLGEDFHSLDNPQDGDKIVYRELGADGQPKVTKTEVYSNGEWAEEGSGGGGGGGDFNTASISVTSDGYVEIYPGQQASTYDAVFVGDSGFDVGLTVMDSVSTTMIIFGDSSVCTLYGDFVSATGNAAWDAENQTLTISGDCTIVLATID